MAKITAEEIQYKLKDAGIEYLISEIRLEKGNNFIEFKIPDKYRKSGDDIIRTICGNLPDDLEIRFNFWR